MKIIIRHIFNHPVLTRGKAEIHTETIKGNTLQNCFEQFYKKERSARYNNYLCYKFIDLKTEETYNKWLSEHMNINLFYGNATID